MSIPENSAPPLLPDSDPFSVIVEYGYQFDGYESFGGFEPLARMAQGVEKRYRETGQWDGTIDQLRGTLFFMLRRQRHSDFDGVEITMPDGTASVVDEGMSSDELEEFCSLYNAIRLRWIG